MLFRKKRNHLFYLLFIVVSFFLLFSFPPLTAPLKSKVLEIISIPLRYLSFPIKEIKKILYYHRTFEEYKRLNGEVNLLRARLIGLEEIFRENTRLEKLLEFKRNFVFSSIAASVIGRDPTRWNSTMLIDKGRSDGIKLGASVVNSYGVIGKVLEVNAHTSKVVLLTDPQFSVAALVKRPRESGLVIGTLQGACRLKYIGKNADIRVGDRVITSKLSASFPEGLMLGSVVQIDQKEPSYEYILQPAVSLSQIEEVLVILP